MVSNEKHQEELRRERHWDPVQRWRAILEMIAWADAQRPVSRNSKQACLAAQQYHLEALRNAPRPAPDTASPEARGATEPSSPRATDGNSVPPKPE